MGGACSMPAIAQVIAVLLDELALPFEDGLVVGIEADDEAGQHPQPALLNDANLLERCLCAGSEISSIPSALRRRASRCR